MHLANLSLLQLSFSFFRLEIPKNSASKHAFFHWIVHTLRLPRISTLIYGKTFVYLYIWSIQYIFGEYIIILYQLAASHISEFNYSIICCDFRILMFQNCTSNIQAYIEYSWWFSFWYSWYTYSWYKYQKISEYKSTLKLIELCTII